MSTQNSYQRGTKVTITHIDLIHTHKHTNKEYSRTQNAHKQLHMATHADAHAIKLASAAHVTHTHIHT